jgi:hypothetical protein
MSPLSEEIRQHGTHRALVGQTGPRDASLAKLDLDAIIVPASRPAAHLDHAITLARAADCWLLVLCSRRIRGAQVKHFLAERSFTKAIVIDLPHGYSHELLHFPALLSLKDELPRACSSYVTDLSMKRNVGLVLARMLQWRRIFFLDDDIRDIAYPDLQSTVNMLGSFPAVGMWVTDFPDNSVVCHANRMTAGSQDVFVSGAALAVDSAADIGFFPDIYNEDWLFFFDDAKAGLLANSCLKATQLCYHPFANPRRAAWQEFGDVLAEGLYALLHLDLGVEQATSTYWTYFLEARRNFLEAIVSRLHKAHPEFQTEMLHSVQSALKCLLTIKPDLCERYIQQWRQDLLEWKRRAAGIPKISSIDAALKEMRLSPAAYRSSTGKFQQRQADEAADITAGPVMIPRFEILKELSDQASTLRLSSATPATPGTPGAPGTGKGDTKPFPVLTPERAETILAAGTGDKRTPSGPDGHGRHAWQLFGFTIPGLVSRPIRRASARSTTALSEPEPVESSEPATPEPEKTPCWG